jgi:cytidylate kinase
MIITISGLPGSGKSTVGRLLASRLGYKFYSIGELRGEIALRMGITIDELNEIGKKEAWTDRKVDEYTRQLGEKGDNFVIDGWNAFHFIPRSFKVFLGVDPCTGAERIFRDQRKDEKRAESVEECLGMLRKRLKETDERYRKHYNLRFLDRKNYDIVIDTTGMKPEEVADRIIRAAKAWKGTKAVGRKGN